MKENKTIEQHQIWEVTGENFLAKPFSGKMVDRKILIGKGEKIEIRFPYAWHFRTEVDNNYFQADEESILKNCKYIGKIWSDIAFNNKAKLEEIIRLELFDKPKK